MIQDKVTIDITLPTSWASLTDKQLRYVFTVVAAGFTTAEVKTYCLCRWGGVTVLLPYGDDFACRVGKREVVLTVETVERATHSLDWLDEPSPVPVRLERIGRHHALAADFAGVPFETYIVADNLYQGFLATRQDALLDQLAAVLYGAESLAPDPAERVGTFYWFASLKAYLAREFRHFLLPAAAAGGNMIEQSNPQHEAIRDAVNAQIRALTKGDITKEKEVLSLDTWRALTELDAQAREYEELNRKYPQK